MRVVLAGDSFALGSGVADDGRLDVQLEEALNALGGERYEVLNGGIAGVNFHTSVRNALALSHRFRASIVVVTFLAANDLELEDVADRFASFGPTLTALAGLEEIEEELFNLTYERYDGLDVLGDEPLARATRREFNESLDMLLAGDGGQGLRVAVLSYGGNYGLFDRAVEAGKLLLVEPPLDWTRRDGMTIPGDGHPTAAANALFARLLAQGLSGP